MKLVTVLLALAVALPIFGALAAPGTVTVNPGYPTCTAGGTFFKFDVIGGQPSEAGITARFTPGAYSVQVTMYGSADADRVYAISQQEVARRLGLPLASVATFSVSPATSVEGEGIQALVLLEWPCPAQPVSSGGSGGGGGGGGGGGFFPTRTPTPTATQTPAPSTNAPEATPETPTSTPTPTPEVTGPPDGVYRAVVITPEPTIAQPAATATPEVGAAVSTPVPTATPQPEATAVPAPVSVPVDVPSEDLPGEGAPLPVQAPEGS